MMKLKYAVVPLIVLIGCTTDPAKFRLGGESEDVGSVAEGVMPNCGATDTIGTNRVTSCADPSIINNSAMCNKSFAPWHQSGAWNQSQWVQCEWHPMGGIHTSCEPKKQLPCVPQLYPRNNAVITSGTLDSACNGNYGSNETQCNLGLVTVDSQVTWHNCRWLGSACKGTPAAHLGNTVAGNTGPSWGNASYGSSFDDSHDIDLQGRIVKIEGTAQTNELDSLKITYADGTVYSHGSNSLGTAFNDTIALNEQLYYMDIYEDGNKVTGYKISSSAQNLVHGTMSGTKHTLDLSAGSNRIIHFYGRANATGYIGALGFGYSLLPPLLSSQ
jgi:hypothetical protein